jgi:heme exporter protein A
VLNGTAFALADGDALVLTGANGAGKSTLLRLMAGLLRPVGGQLLWDGADIADDSGAHNARIAYLGHADAVKPALSVTENVAFWASLTPGKGDGVGAALDALGIAHLADLPARYLSAGQRRRVALCRILTSGASLWLLDEPTTALDSAASAALIELIGRHRAAGGMVAVSTHTDLGLGEALNLDLSAA